ncbi:MAG: N-acetylmuramoyl-L-alanine amidase [Bacteroidetes bacterium]|nr:MAG: N-acetylmuramoyl-L-alanine amidase [Bacteroidota bacterium]
MKDILKNNNRYFSIFSDLPLILIIFLTLYSVDTQSQNLVDRIVIDAGHGGKDPGASGKHSREKDIVLSIALKTGKLINENLKDVNVIYTRKTDVFIPLNTRAKIANNSKADLFISIHCNSNTSSQPKGSETYVMGMHKSKANLEVAMLENSAILLEDDYKINYEGFDPSSTENHIIFNFFQNSFQSQNLDLATTVQSQFKRNTAVRDRGVKSAGFWVLYKTTMPGILIELGFLSNPIDEAYLLSKKGQNQMAKAIYNAIKDYKTKHDALELQKLSKTTDRTLNTNINSKKNEKVSFRVQFLSLATEKKLTGKKYNKLPNIKTYFHKGMYRYTSGDTHNYNEIINLQTKIRKAGFKDAFVIALYNGQRISIAKGRKLSGQ